MEDSGIDAATTGWLIPQQNLDSMCFGSFGTNFLKRKEVMPIIASRSVHDAKAFLLSDVDDEQDQEVFGTHAVPVSVAPGGRCTRRSFATEYSTAWPKRKEVGT